jgi:hypothetical protein
MVRFQTKNPNLGKFWNAFYWKMLIYFMANWNILLRFGECYGHLVHFVSIWYIFTFLVSCTRKNLATLHVIRKSLLTWTRPDMCLVVVLCESGLRGVYRKHNFWVVRFDSFVSSDRILCHPTQIWSDNTKFGQTTQILYKYCVSFN